MSEPSPAEPRSPKPIRHRATPWLWSRLAVLCAAAVLVVFGALTALRRERPRPPAAPSADDDPIRLIFNENPGYVGARVCGECHSARLSEFRQTRHYRACWPIDADSIPESLSREGGHSFTSQIAPLRFELSRAGDELFQTCIREGVEGAQRRPFRMDLSYGSGGKADEVYFSWKDDQLVELPVAWLNASRQWAEQTYNPNTPGDYVRTATTRCLECHNTWFAHAAGTENRYQRDSFLLGVTCERCHGPGRGHVEFHRMNPGAVKAHAIADPKQMSRERQIDLCAQCHSNALRRRTPLFSYRPGEPLDAHFRSLTAAGIENDHVADQTKYLKQSKCYQRSETLTCTTCHHPHRPTAPAVVERACLKCHQPERCGEHGRAPAAIRGQCVSCHMPEHSRVAVKFHLPSDKYVFPMRPHEHRIAVYPKARDETLLRYCREQTDGGSRRQAQRLETGLVAHWLEEAERLRREHRFIAAIGAAREAERIAPSPGGAAKLAELIAVQSKVDADFYAAERLVRERRTAAAIDRLESLLRVKPNHAMAHGRLGTLYESIGRHDQAREHWNRVADCDPDDPYGHNMIGWKAYLDGRAGEAADAFRRADALHPYSAEINYRWSLALLKLQHWPEATERLRLVVAIDPNHAGGHQGLSHSLRRENKISDALAAAERAAALTRFQNADVLLSLCDAYADAGRPADAIGAAQRALHAASQSNPALAPRIRERIDELQRAAERSKGG